MSEEEKLFSKGDWVRHLYHGVGQITDIEEKTLGSETQKYYKVQAHKGTFWIAINEAENDRIRPVVDQKRLHNALEVLKAPPQKMSNKHTARKGQITQVIKDGDLIGFCSLLRDLQARRVAGKLNTTEQRAHSSLKKRVASEWAASSGSELNDINKDLNEIIQNIPAPGKDARAL